MTPAAPRPPDQADLCPICGVRDGFLVHQAREMMFGSREPFTYRECLTCGTLRITEVPADLERHYPDAYYGPATSRPESPGPHGPAAVWGPINRLRIGAALRGARSRWPALARRIDRWGGIPREARAMIPTLRLAGVRDLADPILEGGAGRRPSVWSSFGASGSASSSGSNPSFRPISSIAAFPSGGQRSKGCQVRAAGP
jgi:hypothetical protein